jgi:hypothetical protein
LPPRADASPPIFWDKSKIRIAKDKDGVELLLHVSDFLRSENHVRYFFIQPYLNTNELQDKLLVALEQFGRAVKPTYGRGADKNKRDKASSYIHRPGQITGGVKLVTGWHGIGHAVCLYFILVAKAKEPYAARGNCCIE